jgi:hypothetical protein
MGVKGSEDDGIRYLGAICIKQQELIDKLTRRLDDLEGGV